VSGLRARVEPFGAWVRLPDETLAAISRRRAEALGMDGAAVWDAPGPHPPSAPLEAHVAVTARCPVSCPGCYQNASPHGEHVPTAQLLRTLDYLSATGTFTVAFGGGEPLTHPDLPALADAARARGLTPVVTLSGLGLTPANVQPLRAFSQVNVSHDGVAGGYRTVRGYDGAAAADRAIALLRDAGIAVGINHVLTAANVDGLDAMCAHAVALGVREMQLLRYKPAGRAASLDYLTRRLRPEQSDALARALPGLAARYGDALSLRVDCALVPLLSGVLDDAAALARFGVFGCEAGRHLGSVDREGAARGCSFVPDDHRATLSPEAFRAYADAPPAPCRDCPLRSVCRGGCKVVAVHLRGAMGPDPECPRVRAWEAAGGAP